MDETGRPKWDTDSDVAKCPREIEWMLFRIAERCGKGSFFNAMTCVGELVHLVMRRLRELVNQGPSDWHVDRSVRLTNDE